MGTVRLRQDRRHGRLGVPLLLLTLVLTIPAQGQAGAVNEASTCVRDSNLTVLSWNVFQNRRSARIQQYLRRYIGRHEPEVIFIQEAPAYEARAFHELALFEGYHAFYAPAHFIAAAEEDRPRTTGQLILSRYPFDSTATYVLPVLWSRAGGESVRRNAAYVRIFRCSGDEIGLYNIHLENLALPGGRSRQARHLLEIIRKGDDEIVVVGGDFNTYLTPLFENALAIMQRAGFTKVFRSWWNGWFPRMDNFVIRGARLEGAADLEARGSDHDPLLIEIDLMIGYTR